MLPPLIVDTALAKNIRVIAITDHNASANIHAVQKAAVGTGLIVLPGMEVQTKEEVHCLCLFDDLEQINQFQTIIDQSLPRTPNNPDYFGHQLVVDEFGDFIRFEEQLLITSIYLSIEETFDCVKKLGGIIIPAHIDRKANGLIYTLGFVPVDVPIPALEISRHITPNQAREKYPQIKGYPIIQSGDVHRLEEFIGTTIFNVFYPTIQEIRLALKSQDGRFVQILSPQEANISE
ncbi:MAG: histidinol-phosphatase [Chloroflexi bacterium HGW-Chloroflexi-10]|nr:MAG: histidinol-phosphatase [Chloroflexi bacterium HGW-Chloroflexi-10]